MPDILFSKEIDNRYQFGALCHRLGLLGTAVELGVNRGHFAGHFLAGWGGTRYVAVDHYLPYKDMSEARDLDRKLAHASLIRFGDRVEWKEIDTQHALSLEPENSLDFVYVDADHTYWAVMQEIGMAWSRVRPGGMLAGHDFAPGLPDVVRAVKEHSDQAGVTVWLTMDAWEPWSWYCMKPEA